MLTGALNGTVALQSVSGTVLECNGVHRGAVLCVAARLSTDDELIMSAGIDCSIALLRREGSELVVDARYSCDLPVLCCLSCRQGEVVVTQVRL